MSTRPAREPAGEPAHASDKPNHLTLSDLALLMFMQIAWGGNFVVAKAVYSEISPLLLSALRFLIVAVVLVRFLRWHPGQMRLVFAIAMCTGALFFGFMNLGLFYAEDVAPVAIVVQLTAPFATVLSAIVLHETVGIRRILALAICFGGVAVIGFDPSVLQYSLALGLVGLASLSMAVGTILMRQVRGVPVYSMQAWVAVMSFPILFTASFALEGSPVDDVMNASLAAWAGLAFITLGAGLFAQAGYFYIIQRHEVGLTAPFMLLAPILGALGGVVFLGDVITVRMIIGGAMTLSGVLFIMLRESRIRPRPAPPHAPSDKT